jgi:hypothetical protein
VLFLSFEAWRVSKEEVSCRGLTPMGMYAVDGTIHLFGKIDAVYCQSR